MSKSSFEKSLARTIQLKTACRYQVALSFARSLHPDLRSRYLSQISSYPDAPQAELCVGCFSPRTRNHVCSYTRLKHREA